ncbi:pimeloyl-ACP methyl ester carboxylesterase [Litoreibacter halocynthiae]|uniref:Pimeloyl-ACP methyl ester carboxylesterase n=1 Tax=Litoreibacter halocynthiae TaxID=1242689 RepID=A0A4R7LFG7_9RHOB|nr:alpha/beta hydrolase [Litoreibacter halocynthiae]TDT73322.1 pimeloyl-ACP methyl ester carboxylesterase [Litoreibacter halocynthiae]
MTEWKLSEEYQTSAGLVSAGSSGDGPDLVVAHGWPWSSFSWHRIIPELSKTFKVHWYDMPGYGQSEKRADQRTSLDVQGEVFAEMLSNWNLKQPTVIAHDFGGATTLRAHLIHGCEFERFVLMNVVAMRPWGSAFFEHVGKHIEAFIGLPDHIHKAIVVAYIQGALANEISEKELYQLAAPWLTEDGNSSFYRQFAQADERYTAEIEPLFGDIRCPVKVIWGEDDPWIPIERGRAIHELIGQNRFEVMRGVGHLPQLESPETVMRALSSFL